jgi:hypothetical protein
MTAPLETGRHAPRLVDEESRSILKGIDDPAVRLFLLKHPALRPLLDEVPAVVERCFGADARLSVTVYRDPEASAHRELYVVVHTPLSPGDALGRLAAFDDEWWLDALPIANGKLTVSLAAA